MSDSACRVCRKGRTRPFREVDGRHYLRCPECEATLLSQAQLPDRAAEAAHYAHHENDVADPRFRRFLARLVDPLRERLEPGAAGLDYGCGPGPAAAAMLREAGHEMHEYDPVFRPDPAALARRYDFIFCSEVVEHFHAPAEEFARLDRLLRSGGWLGIMTCFQTDDGAFDRWHYRRDPTHVTFYRESTFRFLARQHGWRCEIPARNVALFRKIGRSRRPDRPTA